MSRPVQFALEVVAGLFIATAGAWLAAKTGLKLNERVNRATIAQERIAAAAERAYPPGPDLTHPSMLRASAAGIRIIQKPIPDPCSEDFLAAAK